MQYIQGTHLLAKAADFCGHLDCHVFWTLVPGTQMLNFGFDAAPITPKLSFTAIGSYLSHEVCKDRSSYGSDCFEN